MFSHRKRRPSKKSSSDRRGTTLVEMAFVLPIFLLFVLGLIEFGHALMVNNTLRSATRSAARLGSTQGKSTAEVESRVRTVLESAIDVNAIHVYVKNGQELDDGGAVPENGAGFEAMPSIELANAESRQLFLVRAKVNYNDIALVPMPFMDGVVLQGQAFMRHE